MTASIRYKLLILAFWLSFALMTALLVAPSFVPSLASVR